MSSNNAVRPTLLVLALLLWMVQPACLFKKGDPEEKTHDVYGTVVEVTPARLLVQTKAGEEEFVMTDASIKGSDFQPGALPSLQMHPHTHHIATYGFGHRPRRSDCNAGQVDGEEAGGPQAGRSDSPPPIAKVMRVGRQHPSIIIGLQVIVHSISSSI